jgi:4-aminobutyrate aminotransferase-like enzyme
MRTSAAGGTFGGNALGCAAAVSVLDTIQDENLLQNASERGSQLAQVSRPRNISQCSGAGY